MNSSVTTAWKGDMVLKSTNRKSISIEELNPDLSHVTGVTGASEDTVNLSKFHGLVHIYSIYSKLSSQHFLDSLSTKQAK